jgi:predicted AlkP superfamily pyrophosphatase or phosphodiesterase
MKNNLFYELLKTLLFLSCKHQEPKQEKSKLLVGIVVDKMRYDYLTRFSIRYGENGFKRLLNNGGSRENVHHNYIPAHTAVGHTSIYTGTTPENHGIISNNWYDKYLKKVFTVQMIALTQRLVMPVVKELNRHLDGIYIAVTARTMQTTKIY